MKIIYISTSCSTGKYKQVYKMRTVKAIEPQQKFNALFIHGLAEQTGVDVIAISTLPISASTCSVAKFDFEEEVISDSLTYLYIPFRNGHISRLFDMYMNTKNLLTDYLEKYKNEHCCIIADVLSPFMTAGCFAIARKYNVPIVGIITDLPELATGMKDRKSSVIKDFVLKSIEKFNTHSLKKYDAYITLTESINDVVNPNHSKKHLVIEGSIDANVTYNDTKKSPTQEVVYAGGVYEKYGVKTLVEAFSRLNVANELHIYGDGTFVEELKMLSKKYPQIKYKGMVSLEEIVEIERKATLLVNPRPSNEEFSKYSFPSKTLEYMSSGTPLLSTKLPGIPSDYFDFIYAIDKEDIEGMTDALAKVLSNDTSILKEKGLRAFSYVKQNKTNVAQAKKIVDFLNSL